jgi:hypothetical protein
LEAKQNGTSEKQDDAGDYRDDKGDFLSNWAIAQMLHAGN